MARNSNKEKLKLSEFLANKYSIRSTFNGTWLNDTTLAFIDTQGNFVQYDVEQEQTDIIVDATVMVSFYIFFLPSSIRSNLSILFLIIFFKNKKKSCNRNQMMLVEQSFHQIEIMFF